MSDGDFTLLVDETGVDGRSLRAMYVGCLIETSELDTLADMVTNFNKACLDDPFYSRKPGLVNTVQEPRHFSEDNVALQSKFIEQVLHNVPCRVYAIFDTPRTTVRQTKVELFSEFIRYVQQVREIEHLDIIIEKSGKDDQFLEQCGAVFRSKKFLPLSIVDYYGAVLHRFHEKRLAVLDGKTKLRPKDLNGLFYTHYSVLVDRVSLERDISTGETSSRRDGRYFLEQIKSIVAND